MSKYKTVWLATDADSDCCLLPFKPTWSDETCSFREPQGNMNLGALKLYCATYEELEHFYTDLPSRPKPGECVEVELPLW